MDKQWANNGQKWTKKSKKSTKKGKNGHPRTTVAKSK